MPRLRTEDGVEIFYGDFGPHDGVPVLLCHGLAAAGEQLQADADYFAGLGYRVLLPDLRGHGHSGKPAMQSAESFSIARMAADLIAVLDDAKAGPVHWVGNSLGGILALQLLPDHAARFRTLATFGTAYALNAPRWLVRAIPWSYALLGPKLVGWLTAQATTEDPAARLLIERLVAAFDPQVGYRIVEHLARYDLTANGVAATLPVLLLRGGQDGRINAALGPALRAMRQRPNFTLVELPAGGHCANLDATSAWRAALLKFWNKR